MAASIGNRQLESTLRETAIFRKIYITIQQEEYTELKIVWANQSNSPTNPHLNWKLTAEFEPEEKKFGMGPLKKLTGVPVVWEES